MGELDRKPGSNRIAIVVWWLLLTAGVAYAVVTGFVDGWTVGPIAAVVIYAFALLARYACAKFDVRNWYVPFFGFVMVQFFGLMDSLMR